MAAEQADGASAKSETGSKASADVGVTTAVGLGWQMAELYQEALASDVEPAGSPDDLPGLSALGWHQLLALRFHQVSSGLRRLSDRVTAGGLSVDDLVQTATESAQHFGPIADPSAGRPAGTVDPNPPSDATPTATRAAVRAAALGLHVRVLNTLTAADPTLGKAYGLGRALADLTLRPSASTHDAFAADFSGRVDTIKGWLHDLKSVLPDHATASLQKSLDSWRQWVADTPDDHPIWTTPAGWADPLHPARTRSWVTYKLAAQGSRWRAVVTGEKLAVDLLSAEDYVVAGDALVHRVGALARRYWAQYRIGISIGLIALGGLVAALLLGAGGSAGGLGALGAIIAATGITWKSVQATLGSALQKVEPSLCGAELDLVITTAITMLPDDSTVELSIPKPAGFSRSKAAPELGLVAPAGSGLVEP